MHLNVLTQIYNPDLYPDHPDYLALPVDQLVFTRAPREARPETLKIILSEYRVFFEKSDLNLVLVIYPGQLSAFEIQHLLEGFQESPQEIYVLEVSDLVFPLLLKQALYYFDAKNAAEMGVYQAMSMGVQPYAMTSRVPKNLRHFLVLQAAKNGELTAEQKSQNRLLMLQTLGLTETYGIAQIEALQLFLIYYWGRSGSLLLQSLFDRHPQVLMTPGTALRYYYQNWTYFCEQVERHFPNPQIEDVLNCFLEQAPTIFIENADQKMGLTTLGEERNQGLVVREKAFKNCFLHLFYAFSPNAHPLDRKRFFLLLHLAYEMAQGLDITAKNWICFHLHETEHPSLNDVKSDFPTLKVLGIFREPLSSFHSYLRYSMGLNPGAAGNPLWSTVYTGLYLAVYEHILRGWQVEKHLGGSLFHELSLEGLHREPERVMKGVADFLGLEWSPSLLESTFNGRLFWGDPKSTRPINGFSTGHLKKEAWRDIFNDCDRYHIHGILEQMVLKMGYAENEIKPSFVVLCFLLPTKIELQALKHAFEHSNYTLKSWFMIYLQRLYISFFYFFGMHLNTGLKSQECLNCYGRDLTGQSDESTF